MAVDGASRAASTSKGGSTGVASANPKKDTSGRKLIAKGGQKSLSNFFGSSKR